VPLPEVIVAIPAQRLIGQLDPVLFGDEHSEGTVIFTPARRLGISTEEGIVLADDCHQAGLVRHDAPERIRGTRLPHSVTLGAEGWKLLRTKVQAHRS
jgi:hypothetical protein